MTCLQACSAALRLCNLRFQRAAVLAARRARELRVEARACRVVFAVSRGVRPIRHPAAAAEASAVRAAIGNGESTAARMANYELASEMG